MHLRSQLPGRQGTRLGCGGEGPGAGPQDSTQAWAAWVLQRPYTPTEGGSLGAPRLATRQQSSCQLALLGRTPWPWSLVRACCLWSEPSRRALNTGLGGRGRGRCSAQKATCQVGRSRPSVGLLLWGGRPSSPHFQGFRGWGVGRAELLGAPTPKLIQPPTQTTSAGENGLCLLPAQGAQPCRIRVGPRLWLPKGVCGPGNDCE